ncbi:MAG: hypothetical protein OQK75_01195 [Gammaproteobacteria bacterium]|nr:hypothetical protein [Gammaproteobacteria bacterium]MCW8986261.1 hypothetical protein [Gammaproteobacteria bacterium]MCW9031330.1 hypothetical protein [Gammaproteobacteria bacterium]
MTNFTKQRDVMFNPLHDDENQARTACQMLIDLDGIHLAENISETHLVVRYDLRYFTLADIEELLTTVGFHLDNTLLIKLKRALYRYTEDTERANLGCPDGQANCTREVFINRYQKLPHGCRDKRPDHWRDYL